MTIAVVGGGNSALEAAIEMDGIAKKVYLVSRTDLTGDAVLRDKVELGQAGQSAGPSRAVEIKGEEVVERCGCANWTPARSGTCGSTACS